MPHKRKRKQIEAQRRREEEARRLIRTQRAQRTASTPKFLGSAFTERPLPEAPEPTHTEPTDPWSESADNQEMQPMAREHRRVEGKPTDLSEWFSSANEPHSLSFLGSAFSQRPLPEAPEPTQTEPSVRPKIRTQKATELDNTSITNRRYSTGDLQDDLSQGMSELGQSTHSMNRGVEHIISRRIRTPMQPSARPPPPIANEIPEPQIVDRYIDPKTGEIDLDKLRQPSRLLNPTGERHIDLANLSRQHIREVRKQESEKGKRKRKYLEDRGFEPIEYEVPDKPKPLIRYVSSLPIASRSSSGRPPFIPQRQSDRDQMHDPRFNKPLKAMDKKVVDPLGPVGRQGYGSLTRRAMSMPDLSSSDLGADEPGSNLEQFKKRYNQLKDEHKDYYKQFRQQINWGENPFARNRMVKAPTLMSIADQNKIQLTEIRDSRKNSLTPIKNWMDAQRQRQDRRDRVAERSVMFPSLGDPQDEPRVDWIFEQYSETIPEEEEEEEEEDEEEEENE